MSEIPVDSLATLREEDRKARERDATIASQACEIERLHAYYREFIAERERINLGEIERLEGVLRFYAKLDLVGFDKDGGATARAALPAPIVDQQKEAL